MGNILILQNFLNTLPTEEKINEIKIPDARTVSLKMEFLTHFHKILVKVVKLFLFFCNVMQFFTETEGNLT